MREEIEIRRALALFGTALAYPQLRQFVFGGTQNERTANAWMIMACLGWMTGMENNLFTSLLALVETKLLEYGEVYHETVIPKEGTNGH